MFKFKNLLITISLIVIAAIAIYYNAKTFSFYNSFEDKTDTLNYVYTDTISISGKLSNSTNYNYRNSREIVIKPSDFKYKKIIGFSFEVYAYTHSYNNRFFLITNIINDSTIFFRRNGIYTQNHLINAWQKYTAEYPVTFDYLWNDNMEIRFNFYNEGGNEIHFDDFSINLFVE